MFSKIQDVLHAPLPLTSMFVVIKKRNLDNLSFDHQRLFSDFFLPLDTFQIPQDAKLTTIEFEYQPEKANCCSYLRIFSEEPNAATGEDIVDSFDDLNISDNRQNDYCYLKAIIVFKGFKDIDNKT